MLSSSLLDVKHHNKEFSPLEVIFDSSQSTKFACWLAWSCLLFSITTSTFPSCLCSTILLNLIKRCVKQLLVTDALITIHLMQYIYTHNTYNENYSILSFRRCFLLSQRYSCQTNTLKIAFNMFSHSRLFFLLIMWY